MYIVNQHGILHSVPDDWAIPAGMRKATSEEVNAFESTGEQETDREKAAKSNRGRTNQPNQTNTLGGGGTAGTMNQPADHGVHQPASQAGNTPANYSGNQPVRSTPAGGWAANPNQSVNQPANQPAVTARDPWPTTPVNPPRPPKTPTDTAKVTLPPTKDK